MEHFLNLGHIESFVTFAGPNLSTCGPDAGLGDRDYFGCPQTPTASTPFMHEIELPTSTLFSVTHMSFLQGSPYPIGTFLTQRGDLSLSVSA